MTQTKPDPIEIKDLGAPAMGPRAVTLPYNTPGKLIMIADDGRIMVYNPKTRFWDEGAALANLLVDKI